MVDFYLERSVSLSFSTLSMLAFAPHAFAQIGTSLNLEDAPVIPAVSISPLPNEQAAKQMKRTASDNLEEAMKKSECGHRDDGRKDLSARDPAPRFDSGGE